MTSDKIFDSAWVDGNFDSSVKRHDNILDIR